MLYRAKVAICCTSHTKHINTMGGKNAIFLGKLNLMVHKLTDVLKRLGCNIAHFPCACLYTQFYLQLNACCFLLLLHVSAADCNHLQAATSFKDAECEINIYNWGLSSTKNWREILQHYKSGHYILLNFQKLIFVINFNTILIRF
jgi:hypothetical protein